MREFFLGLGLSSARQSGKREGWRGTEGVFIVFSPKIAVGRKGTRRLRVYARRLRATLTFSPETAPGHSGQWGPEYPALYPEYPGKAGKNLRFMAPLSCFVAHKCLYWFSWAQDLNPNPWTKSLLIVRRSYTQISNSKTNFLSKLELRFFISFLRVVYRHLIHLYKFTTCTHAQLHD